MLDNVNLKGMGEILMASTIPAFFAGLICWPNENLRTKGRMFWAGVLTVFVAFILVGLLIAIIGETSNPLQWLSLAFGFLILGSLFTLGAPYLIGGLISLLFAHAPADVKSE